jgi:hypothetical protein
MQIASIDTDCKCFSEFDPRKSADPTGLGFCCCERYFGGVRAHALKAAESTLHEQREEEAAGAPAKVCRRLADRAKSRRQGAATPLQQLTQEAAS